LDSLQILGLVIQDEDRCRLASHAYSSTKFSRSTGNRRNRQESRITIHSVPIILVAISLLSSLTLVPHAQGLSQNDAIAAALGWLSSHQLSDGSYGGFTEPQTAPAAQALWIRSSDSPNVLLSFRWLKNQLQNSSTWFWGGGGNLAEADIPGEILYSFAQTGNLQMLTRLSSVATNLTTFQQSNGGFLGYDDTSLGKQVTSSVDTAMALLGLTGANEMSTSSQANAVNYLLSLQNPDGSFNLTKTASSNTLYSLGPEPISITALVLLALNAAGVPRSDPHVLSASTYLTNQGSANFNGHVFAAALALLVFADFADTTDATVADHYILTQQRSDGGFRDISRGSTSSTALDTGWAAVALQLGGSICCSAGSGSGRRPIAM
jgi:prenyltransferase beta subunit